MFATYEFQQIGELFSNPTKIGVGRIRRGLVFFVAILLALGMSRQVVRAANRNLDPTFASDGKVVSVTTEPSPTATPHASEPPHATPTPHASEPPHATPTPHPSEPPHSTPTPHASEPPHATP